ncbi:MAG: DUF4236 domain-containing protein, partial [Acidobacteriota bacterium]
MGFRFRRSVKLAPGVRLNFGMRSASISLGGRGGTLTFGTSGTTATASIPGSGLSYQHRFGSSGSKRKARRERPQPQQFAVAFALDEDGKVTASSEGEPLSPRLARQAVEQNREAVKRWLKDRVDKINQASQALRGIYLSTPPPIYRSSFESKPFPEEAPVPPPPVSFSRERPQKAAPRRAGFMEKALPWFEERKRADLLKAELAYRRELAEWKTARLAFERQKAASVRAYEQSRDAWSQRKAIFDAEQEARREAHEAAMLGDPELMAKSLSIALSELAWPLETNVNFDFLDAGRQVLLDVDLPEIEDVSRVVARVAANGKRILEKRKSQTALRREYAEHVHAIGFRLVGEVFRSLPCVVSVVASAYSQRVDKALGSINDDYLYSVEV